jgi:large subunit ribosomal protein L1
MSRRTKKYVEKKERIKEEQYTIPEAVKALKEIKRANFDESVEISFRLGVDPKYPDQMVRGTVVLPHGTGKETRVLAIVPENLHEAAKKAGADFVGKEDMVEKIEKEKWVDFDVLITSPDMMKFVGKLGKILGPKGLMPSPKAGTVTKEIETSISEVKKGRMEFKVDKTGIINAGIGKISFTEKKIEDNIREFAGAILKAKPNALKGAYVRSVHLSTTMSPSVKIDQSSLDS